VEDAADTTQPTDPGERLRQAKQPTNRLTGPYGHPFHPMLVTIPIGAWVASFLFDLLSKGADEGFLYSRGAYWLVLFGILGAIAAGVAGTIDLLGVARGTPAFRTGVVHLVLNDVVTGLFVISFLVRRGEPKDEPTAVALIVLSAVALALLAVSGWLGGKLAYSYGVRVAAEQDQIDGYRDRATTDG
jgi:uncharacterized membrane protein